jgi:hypothetical protein
MESWFNSILGVGGENKEEQELGRQQASLMAHDEIEDIREERDRHELGSSLYSAGDKKKKAAESATVPDSKISKKVDATATSKADAAMLSAEKMAKELSWLQDNNKATASDMSISTVGSMVGSGVQLDILGPGRGTTPYEEEPDLIDFGPPQDTKQKDSKNQSKKQFAVLSSLKRTNKKGSGKGETPKKVSSNVIVDVDTASDKMKRTLEWWASATVSSTNNQNMDTKEASKQLQDVLQWWIKKGKKYESNSKAKRAARIRNFASKFTKSEKKTVEFIAKMQDSLNWWMKHQKGASVDSSENFDDNCFKLQKANHFYDMWELYQFSESELFDPISKAEEADKLNKDLLDVTKEFLKLSDLAFCADESNIKVDNSESGALADTFNKLKHMIVQLRNKNLEAETALESVEEVLKWWRENRMTFDENVAAPDDLIIYKKAKSVFDNWGKGIPYTDNDVGKLEWVIREALGFWRRNEGCNEDDLEPFEREQLRKIKHITLDLNRFITTKESRTTVKEMHDHLNWWRHKGAKFNPQKCSKAEKSKYCKLQVLYTGWRDAPRTKAERATKEMRENLMWWHRTNKGMNPANYTTPEEIAKFKQVRYAMQQWRARGAAAELTVDQASMDAMELGRALERWENIMDVYRLGPNDQILVAKLKNVFGHFMVAMEDSLGNRDLNKFMREPKNIKLIRECLAEWKNLGGKVKMLDMPSIANSKKEKLMQALLDAMTEWRRFKAYGHMTTLEANVLAKDMLSTLHWWNTKEGKNFDPRSVKEELENGSDYRHNVEQVLGWVNDFYGIRGWNPPSETFSLEAIPEDERTRQVKVMEKQFKWFRKEGQDIDLSELQDEENYQKAQDLAHWWNSFDKTLDKEKAKMSTKIAKKLLLCLRDREGKVDKLDPLMAKKLHILLKSWANKGKAVQLTDKKAREEILDSLQWWRSIGYKCNSTKIIDPEEKAKLEKLKTLATEIKMITTAVFDYEYEDDALAWTKDQDVSDVLDNLPQIMDDMCKELQKEEEVVNGICIPQEPERKFQLVKEVVVWWDCNDPSSPPPPSAAKNLEVCHIILPTLMKWWDARGKEFACDSNLVESVEINEIKRKMRAAHLWLDRNLKAAGDVPDDVNKIKPLREEKGNPKEDKSKLAAPEELRVKEMEQALEWLKKNDVNADNLDVQSIATLSKISEMIPGAMQKDLSHVADAMESALNWLRSSDKKDFSLDDLSVASKKSAVNKPDLAEEARVKDMANALEWLRSNDVAQSYDAPSVLSFKSLTSDFGALGVIPEYDTSAIDWLRQNTGRNYDDMSVSTAGRTGKEKERGPLTEQEKAAQAMASALDWLKGNTAYANGTDAPSIASGGTNFGGMEEAEDWLRRNRKNLDDSSIASGGVRRGPITDEERKAQAMMGALDWLKGNSAFADGTDAPSIASGGMNFAGMEDAQEWLRRNRKLDDSSIASGGVRRGPLTDEERKAQEMLGALDWLKGNTFSDVDRTDISVDEEYFQADGPGIRVKGSRVTSENMNANASGRFSKKRNEKTIYTSIDDVEEISLHHDDIDDFFFEVVNAIPGMPITKPYEDEFISVPEKRKALQVAKGSINIDSIDFDSIDDFKLKTIADVAGIKLSNPKLEAEEKSEAMHEALAWLRNNKIDVSSLKDTEMEAILSLTGVAMPLPRGYQTTMSEEEKSNLIEDSVQWLRLNQPNIDQIEDSVIASFVNIAGISLPQLKLSLEEKTRTIQQSLDWLRNHDDQEFDEMNDDEVEAFAFLAERSLPIIEAKTKRKKSKTGKT